MAPSTWNREKDKEKEEKDIPVAVAVPRRPACEWGDVKSQGGWSRGQLALSRCHFNDHPGLQ